MKIEKGQSLVEMAFGFIVVLIIAGGLFDVGRAYFVANAMEDAVGDAALYFSALPGNEEEALNRAKSFRGGILSNLSGAAVTLDCYTLDDKEPLDCETEAKAGDVVKVTMKYDFELVAFTIPEITGTPHITLTSTASQIITGQ